MTVRYSKTYFLDYLEKNFPETFKKLKIKIIRSKDFEGVDKSKKLTTLPMITFDEYATIPDFVLKQFKDKANYASKIN